MTLTLDLPPELEQCLRECAAANGQVVEGFVRQLLEKELRSSQKVDDVPAIGTEEWGLMNQRRAELIRKKNRQGLTPEERAEYERLQRLSQAALEKAFPRPLADDERLDRLEARLRAEAARGTAETLNQHFLRLLNGWRSETAHLSSSTHLTEHPAYLEIIGLGRDALPLLLRELERSHDGHLSKALTAITGAHPVPPEDRGKVTKVAEAWLRWARENGHKW